MTMVEEFTTVDTVLNEMIMGLLTTHGVPTNSDRAAEFSDSLYWMILEQRSYLSGKQWEELASKHPDMNVASPPPYSMLATRKMVASAAGLTPSPRLAHVEVFDQATQAMQKVVTPPWAYPGEEKVIEEMGRRVTAGAGRHTRSASRDTVIRTAAANNVQWARQLAGAENCGWCAMLASRGAVYAGQSAASFQAHDNCDCTATIAKGGVYEGAAESRELAKMWKETGNLSNFTKKYREKNADALAT